MYRTSRRVQASGTKLSTGCLPSSAKTGVADHWKQWEIIINLIGATTTSSGLKVKCKLDETVYVKGKAVSDEELNVINKTRKNWHGAWNYIIAFES